MASRSAEAAPELSLIPNSNLIFVTPFDGHVRVEGQQLFGKPAGETPITGHVTLSLPKARTLKKLYVELISKQFLVIGTCAHTFGIRHCSSNLIDRPQALKAGTHTFPFAVTMPAKAASSDISYHGRTLNRLVAYAEGVASRSRKMTAEVPLNIVSLHYDPTGVPPSFSLESSAMHEHLGVVDIDLSSKYLMVSGYLQLAFRQFTVSPVKMVDLRVDIVQQTECTRLDEPGKKRASHTVTIPVWKASEDATCAEDLSKSTEVTLLKQMRLPDESKLLPTTPNSAITGLRIDHRIEITLVYTLPQMGDTELEHTIKSGATISSCHCTLETFQLPAYALDEPNASNATKEALCLCSVPEAVASVMYGAPVERVDAGIPAHDIKLNH